MNNVLTFGQYAAVEVPVDAYNIRVSGSELRYSDCLTLTFVPFYIPLPEGRWSVWGRLKEYYDIPKIHREYLAAGGNPDSNPIILKRIADPTLGIVQT